MVYCGDSKDKKVVSDDLPISLYLNHNDTAHYVGMSQCKLCHQEIYNSFLQTGMGKSFEPASKNKSAAKIDKHAVIYDKFSDFKI